MTETANLKLPYILSSQAQKHVTHNEALRLLDGVVQLCVIDRDLATPPASPADGDRYIVAGSPSGDWAGHAGDVAHRADGGWMFAAPRVGWMAWVTDEARLLVFDGAGWTSPVAAGLDMLGINATADAVNRFAVASEATLFDHAGAGHQHKINKAAAGDTASLLFQTGYSGRAEFGLTGDDNWHVKVSADGTTWKESLIADRSTGRVAFPQGLEHAASHAAFSGLIFTPGGDGQISIYRNDTARGQNPRTAVLSAASGDTLTLAASSSSLFFHPFMQGVSYVRIWNTSKAPKQSAWVKAAPAGNQLQVVSAGGIATWTGGETIQIGDPTDVTPGRVIALDISPMLQTVLGAVFPQRGILCKAGLNSAAIGDSIALSPSGVSGSFVSAVRSADTVNVWPGLVLIPCTMPSPISNSNLVLVQEAAAGNLGVALFSSVGVFG